MPPTWETIAVHVVLHATMRNLLRLLRVGDAHIRLPKSWKPLLCRAPVREELLRVRGLEFKLYAELSPRRVVCECDKALTRNPVVVVEH